MAEKPFALLIPVDQGRLEELEHVIEHGLGTFVDYVGQRWDLSSTHAYRQIEAAKVVDILSPIGEMPLPANEAQARELAPLVDDPDAVRSVWAETVHDAEGRITARAIRAHVSARHPRTQPAQPSLQSRPAVSTVTTCPECGHEWAT